MARAIWSGSIGFGLVSPVKLVCATKLRARPATRRVTRKAS